MAQEFALIQQIAPKNGRPSVGAYIVESSAPDNVDSKRETIPLAIAPDSDLGIAANVNQLSVEEGLQQIAAQLMQAHRDGKKPQVVINVHGFNNPASVVGERLEVGFRCVVADPRLQGRSEMVCIGYRWPSEKVGLAVVLNSLRAMPASIYAALVVAAGAWALGVQGKDAGWKGAVWWQRLGTVGRLLAALPIAAILLRSVVYYRDNYRALNYGVPDLVEWVRRLDAAIAMEAGLEGKAELDEPRVELSFIGHSMGALVVTQTVRILSDVFDPRTLKRDAKVRADEIDSPPEIGRTLRLKNLVLVSPDIPAEALMTGRANFLASSLRRFEEIYLFSNGADVVLDIVSSLANYFSFPNTNSQFGHRLGNIEVVADDEKSHLQMEGYGIVNLHETEVASTNADLASAGTNVSAFHQGASHKKDPDKRAGFLKCLRLGDLTLKDLHKKLHEKQPAAGAGKGDAGGGDAEQASLPQLPLRFTYLDCTDAIHPISEKGKRVMGGRGAKRMSLISRWILLFRYFGGTPDVHSGYFNVRADFQGRPFGAEDINDVRYTQQLIYRLAGLGLRGVLNLKEKPTASDETLAEPSEGLPDTPLPEAATAAVPRSEKQVDPEDASRKQWHAALIELSQFCRDSNIKVLLSPEHFQPPSEDRTQ